MYFSLHLGIVHHRYNLIPLANGSAPREVLLRSHTILNLPDAGLDIVQRQVGDRVFDSIEIHFGQSKDEFPIVLLECFED
jgi:hypothetical protein